MKKICTYLFILLYMNVFQAAICQSDITLYTKIGCGNCAYAKTYLEDHQLSYIEKQTEIKVYASEMLSNLRSVNYREAIYMPVIIKDSNLLFPALQSQDGLVPISLDSALSILTGNLPVEENALAQTDDCKADLLNQYYTVGASFDDKERAKHFIKVLRLNGFPNADSVYYNKKYHIYSDYFFEYRSAQDELERLKLKYRGSYILKLQ